MALIKHLPDKSLSRHVEEEKVDGEWVKKKIVRVAQLTKSRDGYLAEWIVLSNADWKRSRTVPMRAYWVPRQSLRTATKRWETKDYKGRWFWIYDGKTYESMDRDLTPDDVLALANEATNRRRIQLEKAHALQAMSADLSVPRQRKAIAQDVKVAVWQRDGGRCVDCETNENLEFDHIIPLAMGGANTLRNLQLLCGDCNRRKGPTLG